MRVQYYLVIMLLSASLLFARERNDKKQQSNHPDEIFGAETIEQVSQTAEIPTQLVSIELIKNGQGDVAPPRFIYKGFVDDYTAPYVKDPVAFQQLVNGNSYSSISPDDSGQFYVSNAMDTTIYNMLRRQNRNVHSTMYDMIFGDDNYGLAFHVRPGGEWITQIPFRVYDIKGTPDNYDDDEIMLIRLFPPDNAWDDSVSWGINEGDNCPWNYNPAYESDWIYLYNFKEEKSYTDLQSAYAEQQSSGIPFGNFMEFYGSEVISRTTINSLKSNPLTTINSINGLTRPTKGTVIRWAFDIGLRFAGFFYSYAAIGREYECTPEAFSDPSDPPTITFISGPSGMYMDESGIIHWRPGYDCYGWNEFILQAQNQKGTIEKTFSIWVDRSPREMRDHNTNHLQFSIANTSILGSEYHSADSIKGSGFKFKGEQGLYSGSLVISNGVDIVVGANLYERETNSDYTPLGPIDDFEPILTGFDQNYISEYSDERSNKPLGLHIMQRSYSNSSDGSHDGYVILDYDIFNMSDSILSNIYVGLFTDWDVGGVVPGGFDANLSDYDSTREMLYTYNTGGVTGTHFGSILLSGEVSGMVDYAPTNNIPLIVEAMTQEIPVNLNPTDVQNMLSTGPYTIEGGHSVRVVFAVLGGEDLTDLKDYADAARNLQLTGNSVTFRVNMNPVIEQGIFNPGNGDILVLRGSFNSWDGISDQLSDTDSDGIYEYMRTMTETAGTNVEYKFVIVRTSLSDIWESLPNPDFPPNYNRIFHFSGRDLILPVTYFDNNDGTNPFTQIDLGELTDESLYSVCVCWADFNEDGLEDVVIGNDGNNSYFLQTSSHTFVKQTASIISTEDAYSCAVKAGDYNNDGHLDLFIVNCDESKLYRGAGDGSFIEVTTEPVTANDGDSHGATWVDVNLDGWLDLYVCNINDQDNFYYLNSGSGTFTKVTTDPISKTGGNTYDCVWSDFDGDGDPDLFVANGYEENNLYFHNDGNGNFTQKFVGIEVTSGGNTSACAAGDFDNDGDFDLFVTNYTGVNWFYVNDGSANFTLATDVFLGSDRNPRSCDWIDFNNDGWLDIYIANDGGFNQLFRNNGDGSFYEIPYGPYTDDNFLTYTSAWNDFNLDGKLDLFAANREAPNNLYVNTNPNNWLQVKALSRENSLDAIGSRIEIKATIWGNPIVQTREITTSPGRNRQNSTIAAYGLGETTMVDSIRIWWPGGSYWDTTNVAVNQLLQISEPVAVQNAEVQTLAATSLDQQGANLNGKVNTKGVESIIRFVYGETSAYGDSVTAEQSPLTSTTMTDVWFDLNGLKSSQQYHYKVVAVNTYGRFEGEDISFTTLSLTNIPQVSNAAAKNVSITTAVFTGTVNPNDLPTGVKFYYGETSITHVTEPYPNVFNGTSPVEVEASAPGLTPNKAHFFQMVATNDAGSDTSDVSYFTTLYYPNQVNINTDIYFPDKQNPRDFVSSDYRIFGLPTALNIDIKQIIGGEQGKDWQLYWDNGAASSFMASYSGQYKFEPGIAYWLINKGTLTVDLGNKDNTPINSEDLAFVDLHSGWNLITDPFVEDINWVDVQEVNGISDPLWMYNGSFSQTDKLKPFQGYYLFNSQNKNTLIVPYLPAGGAKKIAQTDEIQWRLNVDISNSGGGSTSLNLGFADDADEKADCYDHRAPRGPANMLNAYFNRPEWDEDYPAFASDIRPPVDEYQDWPFSVEAHRGEKIEMNFSGIEMITENKQVYLADLVNFRSQNLREKQKYDFTAVKTNSEFRILIGTQEEIDSELAKILPMQFALGQNFPNPFNPETIIPVDIPESDYITVSVYNVLGQKILDLFNGEVDRGRHFYLWPGRDSGGKKLPSGLYFYHVRSHSGQVLTGKMVLIK